MEYQRTPSKTRHHPNHRSNANGSKSVGASPMVSFVSPKFRNPHHYRTEEALSSLNLFDGEDHDKDSEIRTWDSPYPRERSPNSLRSFQKNADQFRNRHQRLEKFENDYELENRAEAAEDKAQFLSKELKLMTPSRIGSAKKGDANVYLQQKVRKLCEDKIKLYLEFASEIRARLSDRSAANEALKLVRNETQSAHKEKNSLQLSLENDLDRRSGEWKNSMEKIKSDNKRLRDRVRDLAEQNVASQREVLHLNTVLRVVKNNLSSKEKDAAHFHEQVEKLVQNEEVLKMEIRRIQDLLSTASHKARELEFEKLLPLQMREKNERVCRLEDELRIHLNEIPLLRDDVAKVAKERDLMRQRMERLHWENVRLNRDLETCERKVEKLDEDLMLKDGQICILKASHHDSFAYRD